jgi:hypothetical protein
MKDLIKNDDAVSVVVGSILVLAVLVTFMSVVTSSWVPVYEGNAESDHGEQTYKTFMDLHKQIEFADEFPRSTAFDLGTDEMSFIQNSNSVGYLEVNESDGVMALTSTIQSLAVGGSVGVGDSLSIVDLNLTQDTPIREFTFNFTLDTSYVFYDKSKGSHRNTTTAPSLPDGFTVVLQSDTPDRLKIIIEEVGTAFDLGRYRNEGMNLSVRLEYWDISGNVERWGNTWGINNIGSEDAFDINNSGGYTYLDINMLSTGTLLKNSTGASETLHNLTQHYMKQPDAGTYDLCFIDYSKIVEGTQTLCYNTTTDGISGTSPVMDNLTIGGGTLTLQSNYNFFVDQSYIYDSGAVILMQDDGAVFKVNDQILVSNDSNNNLILTLYTTVLQGNCLASGNSIETVQTKLDRSYTVSGFTNDVTITKSTTPELSKLWNSYFDELNKTICTTSANSTYNSTNMTLHIWSSTPNILLTVEQKEIEVS